MDYDVVCGWKHQRRHKKVNDKKNKGLTDAELIAKYGNETPQKSFKEMITVLLSVRNLKVPTRNKRHLSINE